MRRSNNKKEKKQMKHEVDVLRSLEHDHIVNFFHTFRYGDNVMLCMEYCSEGTLSDLLETLKPDKYMTETRIVHLAIQISSALKYLHKKRIIQRDLKPANIFLTDDDTIKVGDFGISRSLENTIAQANTFIGSPLYMAAEILCFDQYTVKVDVWSFGCCLYEMMTLHYAFPHKPGENILFNIRNGKYPALPSRYSENLNRLVQETIVTDTERRLSSSDVYSFLMGMSDEKEIPVKHKIVKPDMPNDELLVKAYGKFIHTDFSVSYSSDNDTSDSESEGSIHVETEYFIDNDINENYEDTLQETLQSESGDDRYSSEEARTMQDASGFHNVISQKMYEETIVVTDEPVTSVREKRSEKRKKKRAFLKEKAKETRAAKEQVTLFTRGQRVEFTNQTYETDEEESYDLYSADIQEKCKKDIGEELYNNTKRLVSAIQNRSSLKDKLKEMLGNDNYEKYKNLFLFESTH